MTDQDDETQEAAPPASSDSDTVNAALQGIPGLAESVGNRPTARTGDDAMQDMMREDESEPPMDDFGTPKPKIEDSDTVQQALKQLGLQ